MTARWSSSLSWDTRVVYNERQQRWWWNAWLESTATELYGFADSEEEAARSMYQAVKEARTAPSPDGPQGSTP
ncbi:MAG: hypothetical protein ACRDQ0_20705 [Pseudonocardia sp.]